MSLSDARYILCDTLNPLKRVSFLLTDTVYGHAPGSPHTHPAALDFVFRQDNADQTDPAGGPCPGDYTAGDFPDGDKLIEECCIQHGFTLLALETDVDHIHCFVSAPPGWSPAVIAGLLKGYTSRRLRERYPKLKRQCGKEQLWTQAYYVGTAGSVSAEVIRRYIQECQGQ